MVSAWHVGGTRGSGIVSSGRPLARGDWNPFQWSPTGRLKKLAI